MCIPRIRVLKNRYLQKYKINMILNLVFIVGTQINSEIITLINVLLKGNIRFSMHIGSSCGIVIFEHSALQQSAVQ